MTSSLHDVGETADWPGELFRCGGGGEGGEEREDEEKIEEEEREEEEFGVEGGWRLEKDKTLSKNKTVLVLLAAF